MTEDEVKVNYRSFGGVPRHVFGSENMRNDALDDSGYGLECPNMTNR